MRLELKRDRMCDLLAWRLSYGLRYVLASKKIAVVAFATLTSGRTTAGTCAS